MRTIPKSREVALAPAHRLIDMGVPVFVAGLKANGDPIPPPGWQHTKPDHALVDKWRPGKALCAVTGVKFDVLDTDPRNGGKASIRKLSDDLGDDGPDVYWLVKTPSGGTHRWIARLGLGTHPGLLPGLDLKGEGGFVFIPPTVRPGKTDGVRRAYETAEDLVELNGHGGHIGPLRGYAERCVAKRAGPNGSGPGRPDDPDELRDACLTANDGGQRWALLRYERELARKGYTWPDRLRLLRTLVGEMPTYPSDKGPWWPAKGKRDPDFWFTSIRDHKSIPDAEPGELDGPWEPQRAVDNSLLANVRSGDWLNQQRFDPLEFAVPGLLPAGVVVIAGPPFAGKGLLVLRFVLECARGGEVFGQPCEARDSFYLALEDSDRRMQDRARSLLGGDPIPRGFSYITRTEPGKLIPTVSAWLAGHPTGIVVVDTLGKALEKKLRDETIYDRDYRIMGKLTALAARYPGSVIVVNTHTRKARAEDFVDTVSGTNAIAGAADTVLVLGRKRGSTEGSLMVTSRDLNEAEYALLLERPGGWRLDGEDLLEAAVEADRRRSRLDERSQSVVEFVNSSPEGVTIADVIAADLVPRDQVKVYLARLYDGGHINRLQRGVYGPYRKMKVSRDG